MVKDWHKLNFIVPIKESVSSDGEFLIKGPAINVTTTRNGTKFIAKELRKSATSLNDKPILKDHNNSVDSIVGRTTMNNKFNETNKRVDFEARIVDESMREKINQGLIKNVSVGAVVEDLIEHTDKDTNEKSLIATGIDFVELSLVAVPADPNAGFAKALMESYNLKQESEDVLIINERKKEEVITMSEEKTDKKIEAPVKEEIVESKPIEVKIDTSDLKDVIGEAVKAGITEGIKAVNENALAAQEEPTKEEDAPKEEPVKEDPVKEEPVADETKGEIATEEPTNDQSGFDNYVIERSETGTGFSLGIKEYPTGNSKLNPNADYPWEEN